MRVSQMLIPTLREVPAEAEVVSHKLLLRAGFIRKSAAGVYTYLPLAWRVLEKIQKIVREEMNREGGQEVLMPIMQPAELWRESGRWDVYGEELIRFKDRHDRNFCLGPTHEEIITDLVRGEVNSYKQMPLLLYQMQNKYRDERRPRFGLLRGREFIMKDLYSFDRDEKGLDISYKKMYRAYSNVFSRCGMQFRVVEADSGAIGGSDTHEFMVLADSGEAEIVYCENDDCSYAANVERAISAVGEDSSNEVPSRLQEVHTPDVGTIEELTSFLDISAEKTIKTIIYSADDEIIAALVRGDREVNEVKLYNELNCLHMELASAEMISRVTGGNMGFSGPVNLDICIIADHEVKNITNAVTGANRTDYHLINVNAGRDFEPDKVADIRMVQAGEACPYCSSPMTGARGIEVGQVFKLGDKYSRALEATFLDERGKEQYIVMGCYGIGISRVLSACVEQNNDEQGIIWPGAIAPYHVVIVPINVKDNDQLNMAERVYNTLSDNGIETVLDDRQERPGVKFKDADLIGYPLRITIGSKALESSELEVKKRSSGDIVMIPEENVCEKVKSMLSY
ncbi:MAG: proline--tRNA ligase [Clostridiales bacterium]|nr:proline--tRNA ligase [Clostridiales bacterium]MCF8022176.1 proline--tRNA ligase [Clostridiales bacterium]